MVCFNLITFQTAKNGQSAYIDWYFFLLIYNYGQVLISLKGSNGLLKFCNLVLNTPHKAYSSPNAVWIPWAPPDQSEGGIEEELTRDEAAVAEAPR